MSAFVTSLGGLTATQPTSICRGRKSVMMASQGNEPKNPFAGIADVFGAFRRLVGVNEDVDESLLYLGEEGFEPLFDEEPPLVLVIGATGEVGRIIVRKLLLRGYRVRVLVRNLFSSTLDVLGTGVQYVMGDVNDSYSLMEAVSDVDKVVCAIKANTEEEVEQVEFEGVKNIVRAFHDVRHTDYGKAEATKVTLFKFNRPKDFARWKTEVSQSDEDFVGVRRPAITSFKKNVRNNAMFTGRVFDTYTGHAELSCKLKKLNMRGFSGIVLRCLGDGKQYKMVLRTAKGNAAGVFYETTFGTVDGKWSTIRLPLVNFKATSTEQGGGPVPRELEELDRSDIQQIKIEYRKPLTNPERDSGLFSLTLDYMKAYRTQYEADFVLVSCSQVTDAIQKRKQGEIIGDANLVHKFKSEEALRSSGISYCIVRSGRFTDRTGGSKALVLEQSTDELNKEISPTDLAEICVETLQDPRARNVTFDAYESPYAPTAQAPSKDIGALLEGLRPNS